MTYPSYTFVNNLQPGEFAVIQHRAKKIIWHHDPDEIKFNSFHLPGNYFQLLGDVHKLSDKPVQLDDITVTYIRPNQTLVVRDPKQRIRFIEEATSIQPLTLRRPWHFENLIGKSQAEFIAGSVNDGNAIARVLPGSSDWAVLINQQGRLEFLPSMLNGQPYYFYQPQQTYIRTINQNKLGVQKFDVSGVGEVSIVNLVSGEVASCRIKNVHFMLDVSPQPYIFVAPNLFLDILPANKFHTKVGDLNRIYLKPQQQAVVSVDGKAIILPDEATNKCESQGNGVYIYRSFQFEVYGPENRNKKEVQLGPIQFFNIGVGEVAYGNDEHGDLKIWRQGAHIADNNKNQRMQGFYDVNVDPININNLKITSKHMITSHIDVYGSFSITDAVKAISKFKDHKQLHDYISQTIKAEIIRICADRPPIGYSDADFGNAVKPTSSKQTESKEDSIATIIDLCKQRSNKLLHNFGIDLSDIDITRWELDPKFTEQAAQSAIKLQKARAENEMEKMASDKQRIENDRKIQEMKSKIDLQKYQNEIKQLEVESKAHTLATEKTAMALAEAKADYAVAEIKAKVTNIESQIKGLQAQGEKALGVAKSEIAAANERAKLPDLTAAQRLQLEEAKIHGKNLTELITMLAKTQMTMPGVFQLDPQILQLQALSQIAQAQSQPNVTLGAIPFATSQASTQTPISNIVSSIGAIANQTKQPDKSHEKQAQL